MDAETTDVGGRRPISLVKHDSNASLSLGEQEDFSFELETGLACVASGSVVENYHYVDTDGFEVRLTRPFSDGE
jgi:hypothetical protein